MTSKKRAAARLLFLLAMGCEEKTGLRKDRFEIREKSANIEKNRRQTIRRQTSDGAHKHAFPYSHIER